QNHGSLVHAIAWSFVWVLLLDVLVSFGFYAWLKSKAPALSKWMAGTRLLYSLILAVGIYDLFDAVPFPSESDIQSYEALKHFHQVFSFGLILFGVHLFLLGLLLLKNQNIPKILGILALFAGVCYSMVHLMPHLGETLASLKPTAESILALPMAAGELILAFWMIFKGKRSL
ncbi:MAG: DUF4386 domain-containing protein, partial [Bacteroidota bacterium]|nr:DUF4386 domain-containing protein [Bacteroidota bacterium]MDX5429885.1 DUF4386 domain-containing protein [Bacteroidota bacterium]MDX5468659.1 DUF4386 domain-containing protein [Bacteroidota bacterium]